MSAVMTRDERLLLAAVSRHLREQFGGGGAWQFEVNELTRASFDEDEISVYRRDRTDQVWPTWGTKYRFRTVTEGVDLAVALGLLPAEFSSAHDAGYRDGRDDYRDDGPSLDDVAELFRITANLDTPHEPYLECRRCEDHVASLEDHDGTPMTSLLDAVRDHFELYHADEAGGSS